MSLATELQSYLDAQAARNAARTAERLARDAFIQSQFPVLNTRLLDLVTEAVGQHSRLAIATTSVVESVTGRSFATLNETVVQVTAMLDGTAQTVKFAPRLDFREADQFGAVGCTIDFNYVSRRSRRDALAADLLDYGLQMTGSACADLMLKTRNARVEASAELLEGALIALLLRG